MVKAVTGDTNGFLDEANNLLSSLTGFAERGAAVYSTFTNSQANLKVAEAQKIQAQNPSSFGPQTSDIFESAASSANLTKIGILIAVVGSGFLIWKAYRG